MLLTNKTYELKGAITTANAKGPPNIKIFSSSYNEQFTDFIDKINFENPVKTAAILYKLSR